MIAGINFASLGFPMAFSIDGDTHRCSYAGGAKGFRRLKAHKQLSALRVAGCFGSSSKQPLAQLPC